MTLDPAKLAKANVSEAQVIGVLAANNLTIPSGQVQGDGTKIPVSTIGVIGSVDADPATWSSAWPPAAQAPAACAAGGIGPARRVRPAERQPVDRAGRAAPPRSRSRSATSARSRSWASPTTGYARTATPEDGGHPSLSLSVTKTSTANTVQVADAVTAKLAELGAQHADTVSVTVVSDLSSFIKESRDGLLREGGTRCAVRGPDDLPVPVQPPLDARRGGQHPAVDPRGPRDHADHRASR